MIHYLSLDVKKKKKCLWVTWAQSVMKFLFQIVWMDVFQLLYNFMSIIYPCEISIMYFDFFLNIKHVFHSFVFLSFYKVSFFIHLLLYF